MKLSIFLLIQLFLFDPFIESISAEQLVISEFIIDQPSPGAKNLLENMVQAPVFSKPGGYYSDAFNVSLQNPDPEVKIYYTTNGIRPTVASGILYQNPVLIQTTTPLSAVAYKNGTESSEIVAQTYFFIDSILKQPNNPKGYPAEWGSYDAISGIAIADYEMDPEVCNNPVYKPQFAEAFQSIPSISVVTDPDNIFSHSTDPEKGGIYIYTCPSGKGIGDGWERPASVEYFDPKSQARFHVNCGIQLHGGASRVPEKSPKHSFKLYFRSEYGPAKLNFPLFEETDAITEFNALVLRASFGYTWIHWAAEQRKKAQYITDPWAKDSQLAMGYPSAHNKFVHLFLNGMYWGMYNVCEKPDKDFMNSYLEGPKEDFDVIKDYTEVIDGDLIAWNSMMAMANKGLQDLASYQKIQGNNPDGTPNFSYPAYLDVENLIDYMLLNFYAGNIDWDHHNWVAARNKTKPGKGFSFFSWDAENIFTGNTTNVTNENNANCPSRLFTKLRENAEFRILLADHIQRLFFKNGVFTPELVADRYMRRADEVEKALLCESARWGDYRRDVHQRDTDNELYTRDKNWITERDRLLKSFFPERTNLVVNQLRTAGMFPSLDAPVFSNDGGLYNEDVELTMTSHTGIIYYTMNNADPRAVGGEVASTGVHSYKSALKIKGNGTIKARVKDGIRWSAITEATFSHADSTLLLIDDYGTIAGTGNFPNPFNRETNIWFNLEKESQVQIDIFTAQGKYIGNIFGGRLGSGTQYQTWNPGNLENGIYLYKVQTDSKTVSGKMVYME